MNPTPNPVGRRSFLKSTVMISAGVSGLTLLGTSNSTSQPVISDDYPNVIGPREGFSPHVGTLVSMMTWMRSAILYPVAGMSQEHLDYLHDANSNTIGSMLLHLAATERYYQVNTFEGKKEWDGADKQQFEVAMNLGEEARKTLKGKKIDYYLGILKAVREKTLAEFRKRDDQWLLSVDKDWGWGPTNNYCKWFHVCEHESNHNGQIKWIKGRLPGTK